MQVFVQVFLFFISVLQFVFHFCSWLLFYINAEKRSDMIYLGLNDNNLHSITLIAPSIFVM